MRPLRNFKLTLEYIGTEFHGWQRQPLDATLQGTIEQAIRRLTGEEVNVIGAGRTDAGVHALGQVASFRCATRLSPLRLQSGLNALLPESISVLSCHVAPDRFDARRSARGKIYEYRIVESPIRPPFAAREAWWIRHRLDLAAMRRAAKRVVGREDFRSFAGADPSKKNYLVDLRRIAVRERSAGPSARLITIRFEADRFLKQMVRAIVGTLVEVGRGRIPPAAAAEILRKRDRRAAGPTAPPQGLFLVEVIY